MKRSDRRLGLDRPITRRDFVHDLGLAALGLGLPAGAWAGLAGPGAPAAGLYYPPTRTGLRGSHPGSFEVAHALAREGRRFADAVDLDEEYDLVVVGGGLSGLAAAWFYRQQHGAAARILVLDNHDDFGGHAKRNEFHQGGPMRLSYGGTVNMEYPKYSEVAMGLLEALGVDIDRLLGEFDFDWRRDASNLQFATWFDADTYGRDVLLPGVNLVGMEPAALAGAVERFPLADADRAALQAMLARRDDVLAGLDDQQKIRYLHATPYTEFLRERFGLPAGARQIFVNATMGYWGVPADCLSAAEGLESGLPGAHALGSLFAEAGDAETSNPHSAMFPDGNASLARLLVRQLIPESFPDLPPASDPFAIVTARLDYARLDTPGAPARIRLNSTVVNATPAGERVRVTYVRAGQAQRVGARHCVLACYNRIIPYLCPALPEAQKAALSQCIKRPMVVTNVVLRDARSVLESGVSGAYLPGRMLQNVRILHGMNIAGYRSELRPDEPLLVNFFSAMDAEHPAGLTLSQRNQAGRARLLALDFEDFEREVRTVLNGVFAPGGFDAAREIIALTVNRWPHGYARDHLDLEDPAWNADPPPNVVGRQPFGRITIANSDAGADAYTHTAFDQAWRAVNELPG